MTDQLSERARVVESQIRGAKDSSDLYAGAHQAIRLIADQAAEIERLTKLSEGRGERNQWADALQAYRMQVFPRICGGWRCQSGNGGPSFPQQGGDTPEQAVLSAVEWIEANAALARSAGHQGEQA